MSIVPAVSIKQCMQYPGTRLSDTVIARTVAHDSPVIELNNMPLKSDP